ncbi:hypothetical protein [Catenulispora subtropica]|uniref:Intein C-terminal splicing domain-containing protein n=1 Tax=Catenulispora subtropica TaxID=450798 RepID=A0ABN2SA59_9ACTN
MGGVTPAVSDGDMWDLSVPGDHDFYVVAGNASVLVHNCPPVALRSSRLTEKELQRVSFRYQRYATGTDTEVTWNYNGEVTEVDGDTGTWIQEAKWTGGDDDEWPTSNFNPAHRQPEPTTSGSC